MKSSWSSSQAELLRLKNTSKYFESYRLLTSASREKVDLTKYIERHSFTYDQVIDSDVSNEELYERAVQPLVTAAFEGLKVTCFAYGQTGSGKTYTMMGPGSGDL